jgi:hypothetical protein
MLLFLSSIIITIVYNKSEFLSSDEESCSTVSMLPLDKKMIVFSAGGGYWSYYLGVAKYIKEKYDLSNVYLVGTSAGGLSALALSQQVPFDDVMQNSLSVLDEISQYILGVFSLQWSKIYKKYMLIGMNGQYKKTNNVFIAVSKLSWFKLEKRYFRTDSNECAITDAVIVSSWLPFITAPLFQPFFRIGGSYYNDGVFTGKDIINNKNTIVIHPRTFTKMPFSGFWLWMGRDYNLKLYNLGYEHASKNTSVFSILQKLT